MIILILILSSATLMAKILLASKSDLKIEATQAFFESIYGKVELTSFNCDPAGLPPQPVIGNNFDDGFHFPQARLNFLKQSHQFDDYNCVVAIENVVSSRGPKDICYIIIYSKGLMGFGMSLEINFNQDYYDELVRDYKPINLSPKINGYPKTVGDIMHKHDNEILSKNWMEQLGGINRLDQFKSAFIRANTDLHLNKELGQKIIEGYKTFPDFPNPGVDFQDIFAVLLNSHLLQNLASLMWSQYRFQEITHIVGLESRGLILGMILALKLNCGFIPVRKARKLPGECISIEYGTEYSHDKCEMQKDETPEGKRVLIVDDLSATGGSLRAAVSLCTSMGYQIVDCMVLTQVVPLRQKCLQTMQGQSYSVLLQKN